MSVLLVDKFCSIIDQISVGVSAPTFLLNALFGPSFLLQYEYYNLGLCLYGDALHVPIVSSHLLAQMQG
jgi:hypothetical protein